MAEDGKFWIKLDAFEDKIRGQMKNRQILRKTTQKFQSRVRGASERKIFGITDMKIKKVGIFPNDEIV